MERLLAKNTIDVNIKDPNDMSPLLFAATAGYSRENSTIIYRILAVEDVDIPDTISLTQQDL